MDSTRYALWLLDIDTNRHDQSKSRHRIRLNRAWEFPPGRFFARFNTPITKPGAREKKEDHMSQQIQFTSRIPSASTSISRSLLRCRF